MGGLLAADPRVFDAVTPLTYLAKDKDLKVVILVSEDPNASLESESPGIVVDLPVGDPSTAGSWLAVRDPSGDLRRQLEAERGARRRQARSRRVAAEAARHR